MLLVKFHNGSVHSPHTYMSLVVLLLNAVGIIICLWLWLVLPLLVIHFAAFASMDHSNAPSILALPCVLHMVIDITEHLMDLHLTLLELVRFI